MQSSVIFKPQQPKIKKKIVKEADLGVQGTLVTLMEGNWHWWWDWYWNIVYLKTKLPVHYAEDRESQRMPVNQDISALSRKEACRCLFDCTSLFYYIVQITHYFILFCLVLLLGHSQFYLQLTRGDTWGTKLNLGGSHARPWIQLQILCFVMNWNCGNPARSNTLNNPITYAHFRPLVTPHLFSDMELLHVHLADYSLV